MLLVAGIMLLVNATCTKLLHFGYQLTCSLSSSAMRIPTNPLCEFGIQNMQAVCIAVQVNIVMLFIKY